MLCALVSVVLLIPFTYVQSGPFSTLPYSHIEDLKDAFLQMSTNGIIAICVVGNVFSKVIYFYTGTKLVKRKHDSTTRITIDVHHDLIIWGISLAQGWQNYFWPQILGYIMVPIGMGVYTDAIPLPKFCLPPEVPRPAQGPLGRSLAWTEDDMAFGQPTKYWQLDLSHMKGGKDTWDKAVTDASEEYKGHMHNLCCDNCHSHVALALNMMRYNNSTSWNMVKLCFLMLVHGKYVRGKA
nr:hypothetical protein BaRGS_016460 [Batillaria attramentaria]